MSALGTIPAAQKGLNTLKKRTVERKTVANYQPVHPAMASHHSMSLADEPFWNDLPDILQAQVLVALDYGKPKKGQPARPAEKLLWAGTPYLRKRTILYLFSVWVCLLTTGSVLLVELVDDIGGWLALAWAFISIFIFVPRVSRSQRIVYVLTTQRAFTSSRTMFCSIDTASVHYENVVEAKMTIHEDQTGSIDMAYHKGPYQPMGLVRFAKIRDLRDACRVLDEHLPQDIKEGMGLSGALSPAIDPASVAPVMSPEGEKVPMMPASSTAAA